jgi:uncharacterized protein (TIGR03083 family)
MARRIRPRARVVGVGAEPLSTAAHIQNLRIDGRRLGEVAAQTAFGTPVPGCPGWTVEDLVRHVGDVHRWAGTIVRERRQEALHRDFEAPGEHDELLAWYEEGHRQLVEALTQASPEAAFWAWAPAPSALAFWARRQAHETAIHRLDVEQAASSTTPFEALQAADGVDEWLTIASMRVKVPGGGGRTLHLAALDVGRAWLVELGDDGLRVQRGGSGGDCTVRGHASDVFALSMNRLAADSLSVEGDTDVLRAWRESVRF